MKEKFKNKGIIICVLILAIAGASFGLICAKQKNTVTHEIPIAYSTDNNYVYYTLVSMESAVQSANKDTYYKFTILASSDLSEENINRFESFGKNNKRCSVNIINMGNRFSNLENGRWSEAMYYRLILPELLSDNKCIYLDGDTLINKDLTEVYNLDMNNYYIAGMLDTASRTERYKELEITDGSTYICSGVLLMNLEKMRNDNIIPELERLAEQNTIDKKFKFPDQDILNKVCYGHILVIPFYYSASTDVDITNSYHNSFYAPWATNEEDWEKAKMDAFIVHFAGVQKPWSEGSSRNATIYHIKWNRYADKVRKLYNIKK